MVGFKFVAMDQGKHWIEIPASLFEQDGVVRLLVSDDANQMDVMHELLDGTYDQAFVMDDGEVRSLHFDFSAPQSEMRIDDPYALTFAYTRKMMGFLLFQPRPQHVLIMGLGGGSLSKFCYQQLPDAQVTTLEISEHVIELSQLFEIPPLKQHQKIVHADAVQYIADTEECMDVVLIDACDERGTIPQLCEARFLQQLKERLLADGVVVMNLTGLGDKLDAVVDTVEACFEHRPLLVDANESHNKILFAFKAANKSHDWPKLARRAEQLADQHGLDIPHLVERLQAEYV